MGKGLRTEQLVIDIREKSLLAIRTNGKGKVIDTAECHIDLTQPAYNATNFTSYLVARLQELRSKFRWSRNTSCTVLIGRHDIFFQRYFWPKVPANALSTNVEQAMSEHLPAALSRYVVSCRILDTKIIEGKEMIDVLAAAVDRKFVQCIIEAVKQSGLFLERIDVRENARAKLLDLINYIDEEHPATSDALYSSKAMLVLDLYDTVANVSVLTNNDMHTSRYFGFNFTLADDVPIALSDESVTFDYSEPEDAAPEGYDTSTIVSEVSSTIDFMRYRERDMVIDTIIVLAPTDSYDDLCEEFSTTLNLEVLNVRDLLNSSNVISIVVEDIPPAKILDALGASIKVGVRPFADISFSPRVRKPSFVRDRFIPFLLAVAALSIFMLFAVYLLYIPVWEYEYRLEKLGKEKARYTITESMVAELNARIDMLQKSNSEISKFDAQRIDVKSIVNEVESSAPYNVALTSIEFDTHSMTIAIESKNLDAIVTYMDRLRRKSSISDVVVGAVRPIKDGLHSSTLYITYQLEGEEVESDGEDE